MQFKASAAYIDSVNNTAKPLFKKLRKCRAQPAFLRTDFEESIGRRVSGIKALDGMADYTWSTVLLTVVQDDDDPPRATILSIFEAGGAVEMSDKELVSLYQDITNHLGQWREMLGYVMTRPPKEDLLRLQMLAERLYETMIIGKVDPTASGKGKATFDKYMNPLVGVFMAIKPLVPPQIAARHYDGEYVKYLMNDDMVLGGM